MKLATIRFARFTDQLEPSEIGELLADGQQFLVLTKVGSFTVKTSTRTLTCALEYAVDDLHLYNVDVIVCCADVVLILYGIFFCDSDWDYSCAILLGLFETQDEAEVMLLNHIELAELIRRKRLSLQVRESEMYQRLVAGKHSVKINEETKEERIKMHEESLAIRELEKSIIEADPDMNKYLIRPIETGKFGEWV
jgi:hypothetical protein